MLLRTESFSLDPYMCGRMSDAPSYAPPIAIREVTVGGIIQASPAGGQPPLDPKSDAPDAQTEATKRLIESFVGEDKPLAAVCHAPAIFTHTKGVDGKPLASGPASLMKRLRCL